MYVLEHFLANLAKIAVANRRENSKNWRALGPFPQKTAPGPPVANQRRNTTKSTRVKLRQLPWSRINGELLKNRGSWGSFTRVDLVVFLRWFATGGPGAVFYGNGPRARQFFEFSCWFATAIFARLAKKSVRTYNYIPT